MTIWLEGLWSCVVRDKSVHDYYWFKIRKPRVELELDAIFGRFRQFSVFGNLEEE